MADPTIRITVGGKLALTVEQAAARLGVPPKTLSGELTRYKDAIRPAAELDGRKKLYLQSEIDQWWKSRPGRGAPGKPKPHVPRKSK
jgi:hypothetical protein